MITSSTSCNSLSVISTWMLLIILSLSGGILSQTEGGLKHEDMPAEGEHSSNSGNNATEQQKNPTHPLQIHMQTKLPVLLMNLQVTQKVTMNYTLECADRSTVYALAAKSVAEDVAMIIEGNPVLISCNTDVSSNNMTIYDNSSTDLLVNTGTTTMDTNRGSFKVNGEFVMTFKSYRIGRSFLLMFANKIKGSGAGDTKGNIGEGERNKTSGENISPPYKTQSNSDIDSGPSVKNNQGPPVSGSRDASTQITSGGEKQPNGLPPNTVFKSMIIVMQLPRAVDKIFRIVLYIVVISATIGMGFKVEFQVVKTVMKKPIGPVIGLFCQYVCMPLIAFFVAKAVPQPAASISLGIFTCGIVPGGGASNFFCYLLGGDISLSVTMTTISSFLALGLIPLWMFTLGDTFEDDTVDLHVPYPKILETLAIVILPIFMGMLLKYKFPKLADWLTKVLKPVLIIVVLFLLAIGTYANFYILTMIQPMQILAGCLLPYIGYFVGGTIALITCQSWTHVKTIAIETGIQNSSIAFMIVFFSLPPPDNQLAIVAPVASSIMTPLPLIIGTFLYLIYTRHQKKKKFDAVGADGDDKNNENEDTKELETGMEDNSNSNTNNNNNNNNSTNMKLTLWDKITRNRPNKKTTIHEEEWRQGSENNEADRFKDIDYAHLRETYIDT